MMETKNSRKTFTVYFACAIVCLCAVVFFTRVFLTNVTIVFADSDYTLQDSTLIGPDYDTDDWNCYAFALGFEHKNIGIGHFSGDYFDREDTVEQTAVKIKKDLLAWGCVNVEIFDFIPEVGKGEDLICFRLGNGYFHFMKHYKGYWFHKFPNDAILMYNYEPTNDRIWSDEGVRQNMCWPGKNFYDSDILFIKYTLTYKIKVNNGEAKIVGRDFTPGGDIYIPEEIDGYPVTFIADSLFKGCYKILSVELPRSLISIGSSAFEGCTRLEKVETLNANSVMNIGDNAFKNTSADMKFIVPENMYGAYTSSYGNIFGDNIYASVDDTTAYKTTLYEVSPEIRIETNYAVDGDFGEGSEEGFFYEGIGYVGYYLTMYYAHCLIDYYVSDIESCGLVINFGTEADGEICYLFDSDRRQKGVSEVSGGIAFFDFTDIINSDGEFYIVPKEDSTRLIEFSPSDVTLRAIVRTYILK